MSLEKYAKNLKILFDSGGVIQGEVEIYNNNSFCFDKYNVVIIKNGECIVDFDLYEIDSEKEIVLSHKERKFLKEELKGLI